MIFRSITLPLKAPETGAFFVKTCKIGVDRLKQPNCLKS